MALWEDFWQAVLPRWGPGVLVFVTWAETSFLTGLLVPAGVATAFAAFLSNWGHFSLEVVVVAAFVGGVAGDCTGFWVGRRFGRRIPAGIGPLYRLARRWEPVTAGLMRRHPLVAVSGGRLVSFVRTLMPWMAGMSALGFRRFVAFDLVGVGGYVAIYATVGEVAGRNWEVVVSWLGRGGMLAFLTLLFLFLGLAWRRKRATPAKAAPDAGEGPCSG